MICGKKNIQFLPLGEGSYKTRDDTRRSRTGQRAKDLQGLAIGLGFRPPEVGSLAKPSDDPDHGAADGVILRARARAPCRNRAFFFFFFGQPSSAPVCMLRLSVYGSVCVKGGPTASARGNSIIAIVAGPPWHRVAQQAGTGIF